MTAPCPTLGFHVVMKSTVDFESRRHDELLNAWVEFLETRGLCCGGGGRDRMEFVVASEASQATENDRVAAEAWLSSRSELRTWHVGDLRDLHRSEE